MLFYSLGSVLAGSAASGPAAPVVAGVLSAIQGALLLRKLFGGGDKAPAPTPTNPVTGQPVPIDPTTGQVWALDTQSGLPGDLTQQIWQMSAPEGFSTAGYNAGNYVTQGLPIWAANRFKEMSDQLGGWDNLTKWLYDRTNWATVLGIMRNPWGQSTYDQHAEGAGQPEATVNEGQQTQVPEGQGGPVDPQTPEGQASGNPTYGTTTTGQAASGVDPWAAAAAGAAGVGGLAALLSGGPAGQLQGQPPLPGEQFELGPDGQWVLKTTATGQMPAEGTGTGGSAPSSGGGSIWIRPGTPEAGIPATGGGAGTGSIWIRPPLTGSEAIVGQGGGGAETGGGAGASVVTPPSQNTTGQQQQQAGQAGQQLLGGGGGAVVPPPFPALAALAPLSQVFMPQPLAAPVPGLSRLFGGF